MNYGGFYIEKNVGNNSFSYDVRKNKRIYVPTVKTVDFDKNEILNNLELSDNKVAFSEVDEESKQEKNILGLKYFIESLSNDKKIYIFDNHNHCFYFVATNILNTLINKGIIKNLADYIKKSFDVEDIFDDSIPRIMIHFDQHKDMRTPQTSFLNYIQKIDFDINASIEKAISNYTNYELNVGNFIVPLIQNKFIDDVVIVDSTYSMNNLRQNLGSYNNIVLDIDLDFFSKDMNYIKYEEKLELIKQCYDKATLVTICTSPYFIEFERAKNALRDILFMQ